MKKTLFVTLLSLIMAMSIIFTACKTPDKDTKDTSALETEDAAPETTEPAPETTEQQATPAPNNTDTLTAQFDLDGDGTLDDITVPDNKTMIVHLSGTGNDITTQLEPLMDDEEGCDWVEYNTIYFAHADGGTLVVLMEVVGAHGNTVLNPYYFNGSEFTPVSWEFNYKDFFQNNDDLSDDLFSIEWTSDTDFTIRCNVNGANKQFAIDKDVFKELFSYDFSEFDRTQHTEVVEMWFADGTDGIDEQTGEFTLAWLMTYGGDLPVDSVCYVYTTFEFDAENIMFKISNVEFEESVSDSVVIAK